MTHHEATATPCSNCNGTGICPLCTGDGMDAESGPPELCRECNGSGTCITCGGLDELPSLTHNED